MRLPFISDYLAYKRDMATIDRFIDSQRELYEGAAAITNVPDSIYSIIVDENSRQERFEQVSITDYLDKPIPDIVKNLVKTNANVSQIQTIYSVLIAQDPVVTASSDRAQRIIDDAMGLMEEMNNPWSLAIQHMASSISMRGNVLLETEFGMGRMFKGIHVVDPKWYHARLVDEKGSQKWLVGRYINSIFTPIDSPNIRFQGINTLVGERLARSPLQAAVWATLAEQEMLMTLQSLMQVNLFSQRIIKILEMRIAEVLPNATEEQRKRFVDSARERIKAAGKTKPNQPIVLTDNVEVGTAQSGSQGITWVDILSRLFDRKIFSGGNTPPSIAGSNEFVAESSMEGQIGFFSTYMLSGQAIIKDCSEWAWTRVLRAQGNSDEVTYSSKSIDSHSRVQNAKAFAEIMRGIKIATSAGMDLDTAVKWYEFESETTIPADVIEMIEQAAAEKKERAEEMRQQKQTTNDEMDGNE